MTNPMKSASLLPVAAIILFALPALAQSTGHTCGPATLIPLASEQPPAKIYIDPPLAEPLARGVAVIPYCAENLHIVPVFGPNAATVSPRTGHVHVRVDDASWVWADASGLPIILQGLGPGSHKVSLDLVDSNHRSLDKATITFVVPEKAASEKHH
jgi:hypothetical protein